MSRQQWNTTLPFSSEHRAVRHKTASPRLAWKVSAIKGKIPITPISVSIIPNTPTVRTNISKAPERSF